MSDYVKPELCTALTNPPPKPGTHNDQAVIIDGLGLTINAVYSTNGKTADEEMTIVIDLASKLNPFPSYKEISVFGRDEKGVYSGKIAMKTLVRMLYLCITPGDATQPHISALTRGPFIVGNGGSNVGFYSNTYTLGAYLISGLMTSTGERVWQLSELNALGKEIGQKAYWLGWRGFGAMFRLLKDSPFGLEATPEVEAWEPTAELLSWLETQKTWR